MEQLYPSTSFCITARTAGAAAPSQKEAYTPCAHSPTLERAQHGGLMAAVLPPGPACGTAPGHGRVPPAVATVYVRL